MFNRGFKAATLAAILVACALWATLAAAGVNEDLIAAAEKGDLTKVNALLSQGADINAKTSLGQTPLIMASFHGHPEVVKALIAKGADLNAKTKDGMSALQMAIIKSRMDIANMLAKAGAK